jgi:hypothetical protein
MNIVQDSNLINIPFLFIFKKGEDKMSQLNEALIAELSGLKNNNILFLNYDIGIEEVYYGLDWLSENMKSL